MTKTQYVLIILNQQRMLEALLKILEDIQAQGGPKNTKVRAHLRQRMKKTRDEIVKEVKQ